MRIWRTETFAAVMTMFSCLGAFAQDNFPTAGTTVFSTPPDVRRQQIPLPTPIASHKFLDGTNKSLFAGVAAFRALDYASTRNMRARGREEILLNNDVVDNLPAFAAIEAAGTATSIGLSYWLHRKGHHSLERWVSIIHISGAGFGSARNYLLVTKRRVPAF